jgi:glycosyltransferase involved in cell wall biosynthesis
MNILVIAPTPFFSDRGTHIRILEEALALEKRGHRITIATYHVGSDLPEHLATHIDVRRIRRLLFWYRKLEAGPDWQKIILDLLLLKKVFFLARTQKPDVLHAHLHEGVAIGWVVRTLLFWRKMRLVADFHGSLTKEMVSHAYLGSGWLRKFFRLVECGIDNLGDAAVTSSAENTREIASLRRDGCVSTVLDGVSVERFSGFARKSALRNELGLPADKTVIVYAGAFIANKGIDFFLDAIPLILAQRPNAHFLLVGFPYDQIRKRVEGATWRASVTLAEPFTSERRPVSYFALPKYLLASDIGVDPKDSFVAQASGKMLAYMGAGLPVACFDRVNNREYLGDGGVYAERSDAESLARAISDAIDLSPERREALGCANRERAKAFDYAKPAEALERLFAG